MPTKDPTTWSTATWLLVSGLSMLGGVSSWYRRVKSGHTRAFNVIEFFGELSISGLMGFVGFVTADNYFQSEGIAGACAGMSAHFATRLLFNAEGVLDIFAKKLSQKVEEWK